MTFLRSGELGCLLAVLVYIFRQSLTVWKEVPSCCKSEITNSTTIVAVDEELLNYGGRSKNQGTLGQWELFQLEPEWNRHAYNKDRCRDILLAANVHYSKVKLTDSKKWYRLDDSINLLIQLYDGYGTRKQHGGDQIRIRMFEMGKGFKAAAACHVTDFQNGSYGGSCKALWVGRPTISIEIRYPREMALGFANVFTKIRGTRYKNGTFETGSKIMSTPCFPEPEILGYTNVCNLTTMNSGLSWYCGAPKNNTYLCKNWTPQPGRYNIEENILYSVVESRLLAREKTEKQIELTVEVKNVKAASRNTRRKKCRMDSLEKRISNLWNQTSPIGYFFDKTWTSLHCIGKNDVQFLQTCLRNRRIHLFGDSTCRQWLPGFVRIFGCKMDPDQWGNSNLTKGTHAICPNNFTVTFRLHSFPVFVKYMSQYSFWGKSISAYLDELSKNSNSIILIHLYLHYVTSHPRVFFDRMKDVRRGIERFLISNPKGIVFIKGPHSFWIDYSTSGHYVDYFMPIYKNIIRTVFHGLFDKVFYLDAADMTVSTDSVSQHPAGYIVDAMIKYMLTLACNKEF